MRINKVGENISIVYKDRLVFNHSKEQPFISGVDLDVKYKSVHGTFSVKSKAKKIFPLTECTIVSEESKKIELIFKNNSIAVNVQIVAKEDTLVFTLDANKDMPYRIVFPSTENEAIFGGGEQYRKLNLKGEKVINFVSEHIKIKPIVLKTIFNFIPYKPRKHKDIATYSPMTTFMSSERYGIRFDVDVYGESDFQNTKYSTYTFKKCPRSISIFYGDSFKEVNMLMNKDIENNEYLPDWAYDGMILGVQGGINRVVEKLTKIQNKGVSVCGVWCQDWCGKKVTAVGSQVYWNWSVDNERYPKLKEEIASLKEKGVRFLGYINPYLVKDGPMYNYCKEKGYLVKNKKGDIYHIKSTTFDAAMMDLTNEGMVHYLKETIIKENMLDLGIDGYMADFGEYLPVDSVLHNGDPIALHNVWPTIWAKINREAIDTHKRSKEVFFFTRSGYNKAQKYTTMMWNGDQHTDFSVDYGMGCVMPATFNLGFSGMSAVHSDIGGFISFASLQRDEEIFIRWMEMNTFSPLLRSHETIRPELNAQPYDDNIVDMVGRLSRLHKALKPYIMYCMEEANAGIPVMRPDFYNSNDFNNHKDLYTFMLGDEVYVVPILEEDTDQKTIYLPKGEWKNLIDKQEYEGGKTYTFPTPLGTPLAFYLVNGKHKELFDGIEF